MRSEAEIAVVGAGAAGLMAAIHAARSWPVRETHGREPLEREPAGHPVRGGKARILLLDSAKKPGAKILVAGGGRCNVTHDVVDETAYAGSSRPAIRKVLGRFSVADTIDFFRGLGVELKREDTGKLFPTTDDAHTVLNSLLRAAADAGVELIRSWRVESIQRTPEGFVLTRSELDSGPRTHDARLPQDSCKTLLTRRLILATGGQSLPRTGSDGHGYTLARSLGHTITRTFPALVPLTLPRDHFLCQLAGITLPATLELRGPSLKRLIAFTDSTLLTHFGLSGPSVLDISRYWLDAAASGSRVPGAAATAQLLMNFLPQHTPESLDARLADAGRREGSLSLSRFLSSLLPERLATALCTHAGLDPSARLATLSRDSRRAVARAVTELPLPITGSRGFTYAEVTAGGVPLSEVHLGTMESRVCPSLYLCGEILDVDGRIGGYNFQWAWASGFVAGRAAAAGMQL